MAQVAATPCLPTPPAGIDAPASPGSPRLQGLAPVVTQFTHTLLLGSFPGAASLRSQRYYGHPRNQFWTLLGGAIGLPLGEAGYEQRLALLRAQGLGLWDVITEAEREGSLDSAIRAPRLSPLRSLVAELPALRCMAFNGGTAARLGLRELGGVAERYRILALPSSSPAYTLPLADKQRAWNALR